MNIKSYSTKIKQEIETEKVYYKEGDLSKREYNIINNKKVFTPLHIYIHTKDVLGMLDNMYKFYGKRRHELYTLYKGDKHILNKDKEFEQLGDRQSDVSRLKSYVQFRTYKDFVIKFDKKWDERPNREDYSEILYFLSIDGYVPHIDTLEIV